MKRILTLLLLICISVLVNAQQVPFGKEIKAFKTADSVQAPPKRAIVFVGSSSFRMWHNLSEAFPDHKVVNRGFGGSSLPHVIQYVDDIVIPYKPKQVVIYCGDNDFMTDSVTPQIVADRFKKLFELLRGERPKVNIVYVSIKPSPSRARLMPKMAEANALIKDFLNTKRRTAFVNIWDKMLDGNGDPRKELFLKDMLHMNEKGYAIWREELEPVLK